MTRSTVIGAFGAPQTVIPALARAFEALDAAGVQWCLLRGYDELAAPFEGDVDLLIAEADLERASDAVVRSGALRERSWAGGTQRFFRLREDGRFVVVQITSRLSFGAFYHVEVHGARRVLDRRDSRGVVAIVAPGDEFWISLLHCLLDKGCITPKHRARLSFLVQQAQADDPVSQWMLEHCGERWAPRTWTDLVSREEWSELEARAGELRSIILSSAPMHWRLRWLRNGLSLWWKKTFSEPLVRRGPSIALLAPDGAGKSTVAASLGAVTYAPVHRSYLGAYGQEMPRLDVRVPGIGFATRLSVMGTRWAVAQYHRSRRRIVVFDRHPVEARLEGGGGRRQRLTRRLLSLAIPLPDRLVVLDAPSEVLHQRKPEHDADVLERRRRAYLELAERTPRAIVVDATRPVDEVRDAVADIVWDLARTRAR